jgi:ubiquinone/menaquinone biosynthesis C-methylase UbiE
MPEDHMDELYTSKNPLVRFVFGNRLDMIVKELPLKKGLKVLDAGCGEGHLIEKLYKNLPTKTNSYYGIDITKVAIKKAKKKCPYARLKVGDVTEINFADEFFDVVICTEVLEHVSKYKKAIKELKRVLKRGGHLIITFPNETLWTISRFFLRRKPIKVPDHFNSFTPNKMRLLIKFRLESQVGLPFRLPFFMSLGYLMKFAK